MSIHYDACLTEYYYHTYGDICSCSISMKLNILTLSEHWCGFSPDFKPKLSEHPILFYDNFTSDEYTDAYILRRCYDYIQWSVRENIPFIYIALVEDPDAPIQRDLSLIPSKSTKCGHIILKFLKLVNTLAKQSTSERKRTVREFFHQQVDVNISEEFIETILHNVRVHRFVHKNEYSCERVSFGRFEDNPSSFIL